MITTTVCAALIAVLPLAPSLNSDEQAYLRGLHNDGIPVSDDQATVTVGHVVAICWPLAAPRR